MTDAESMDQKEPEGIAQIVRMTDMLCKVVSDPALI